tara:strand:+ start:752 stop:916 length:165 start_codon:yes stop_codon:yes gene_type:complete
MRPFAALPVGVKPIRLRIAFRHFLTIFTKRIVAIDNPTPYGIGYNIGNITQAKV